MKSASVLFVFFSLSFISSAATLRVPQDYPTVQGAVAASVAGDTILVSPGLYAIPAAACTLANGAQPTCGLQLHDRTILQGSGPAQTTFDFSGAAIGALLQNGTATVKLAHLQNAGTAIYAYVGSNLTVTNVIITNSNLGTELNQGNSYTIINTTIDGIHDPTQTGSGIDVPFGGVANIQNNLVTNNDRAFTAGSFSLGTYAYNDAFASLAFNWETCTAAGCTPVAAPASNVSFNPLYCQDFSLQAGSPARHAGNPAIINPDGTVSDLGAYGGPEAILPTSNCIAIVAPPPTVTSISPLSGNRGQTLTVTVSGSNFQPGTTLTFSGSGLSVQPLCNTCVSSNQITATISIASNAPIQLNDVIITNPDSQAYTRSKGFRVDLEQRAFGGGPTGAADEPSLAVDPRNRDHLVIGFNIYVQDANGAYVLYQYGCGWSETFDGGLTWTAGTLLFPASWSNRQLRFRGDPWVRFTPDGRLLYTCTATSSTTANIFLWSSVSGLAISLNDFTTNPIQTIGQVGSRCAQNVCTFTDEPTFTILTSAKGVRIIACWIEARGTATPGLLEYSQVNTSFSDGGGRWSAPVALTNKNTMKAVSCRVGTTATGTIDGQDRVAVTWLTEADDTFRFRLSPDGSVYSTFLRLEPRRDTLLFGGSTTDTVTSVAYANVIGGPSTITALWQARDSGISKVFTGPLSSNTVATVFSGTGPEANIEKFLPGAGACSSFAGMYRVSDTQARFFRYTLWPMDTSSSSPIFSSGADLDGNYGFADSSFPFKRIGEYTTTECTSDAALAAWTDLRNGKPEIWFARSPIR